MAERGKRAKKINTGDDATNRLYEAVVAYIEDRGGAVVVIGGVQTQEWPGERPGKYVLGIQFMGRKPSFPDVQPPRSGKPK